jgi:hypothetical protein
LKWVIGYNRGRHCYRLFRHTDGSGHTGGLTVFGDCFRSADSPSEHGDVVALAVFNDEHQAMVVANGMSVDGKKISVFPIDGSTLHPNDKEAFETIDAMVFSGDTLENPVHREYLRMMIDRWERRLKHFKRPEVEDGRYDRSRCECGRWEDECITFEIANAEHADR